MSGEAEIRTHVIIARRSLAIRIATALCLCVSACQGGGGDSSSPDAAEGDGSDANVFDTSDGGAVGPGLGASTFTCLDRDGDTYGVGPGCAGVDADDEDRSVHGSSEALTKWGGLMPFLAHRGYTPLRAWYIATDGDDSKCAVDDVGAPCATFARIQGGIAPGDVVLYRGGTYSEALTAGYAASGTESKPITYMAYPGERVVLSNASSVDVCAAGLSPDTRNYITIEGFVLDAPDPTKGGEALTLCLNDHVTLRYNEALHHGRGFFGSFLTNVLVEYNVSHDTNIAGNGNPSHTLYFAAREVPNANITIRSNLFWNPGRTCIQHNGRVTNLLVEGNVCYDLSRDAAAGISLEMGASHSIVRNNLVFNASVKPFVLHDYPNQDCLGVPTIVPYDETDNLIENNTFVVPAKANDGSPNPGTPNIVIGSNVPLSTGVDLGHNTFRNNLLINHSGSVPIWVFNQSGTCSCVELSTCTGSDYETNGPDPSPLARTLTWDHNDVFLLSSYPPAGTAMRLSNTGTTLGTPPEVPPAVDVYLDWAGWTAFNGTTVGSLSADPLFAAYDDDWYATPERFDFRLQTASPVLHGGAPSTSTSDIRGVARGTSPSVGAYEGVGP